MTSLRESFDNCSEINRVLIIEVIAISQKQTNNLTVNEDSNVFIFEEELIEDKLVALAS